MFEEFEVGYYSDCREDWLEVHDGDSPDSDMIGEKLCGYEFPGHMESTGHSITLVFHSDNKDQYKGFRIKVDPGRLLS